MNLAALYHRPDSEMAYLVKKDDFQIRLRTGTNEVEAVILYYGDPYDVTINDKKKQIWEYQIQEMALQASTSLYDYWQLNVSVPLKRLQYFFKIKFKNGEEFLYDDRHIWSYSKTHLENSSGFRMPYFHEIDRIKTPDWVKKTVWYQIFPERFANGDHSIDPKGTLPWGSEKPSRTNFFGGDLQGVIDHLDYLEDLGINGIYFCPIFAAHSNHKYDTIDYFNIDPAFGSKEKFKELVDKAHERGIKIMLDAVFNHMGDFSMQWQDVIKNGEKSRFAEWFHINKFPVSYDEISLEQAENLTYEVFAKTPHMPKLNTANPEVQDYREFQYFVCDYLKALQKFLVFDDIDKIRPFIETKQWWDTIDSLDTVIGNINDSRVNDLMLKWSVSDDIWFRRIAINHQRGRKDKTDTVLLEKILINNLNNNEFFINKSIGWALRDYSKTNTDWVKNFITKHKSGLSTLSIREASKYLE